MSSIGLWIKASRSRTSYTRRHAVSHSLGPERCLGRRQGTNQAMFDFGMVSMGINGRPELGASLAMGRFRCSIGLHICTYICYCTIKVSDGRPFLGVISTYHQVPARSKRFLSSKAHCLQTHQGRKVVFGRTKAQIYQTTISEPSKWIHTNCYHP